MKLFDSFFKHALIRINKRNIIYLNATRYYCNNINYNALINLLNKKNDINKEINALYSLLERLSNYKYKQYKDKLTLKNNINDEIKITNADKINNINIERDMNISHLDHHHNNHHHNNNHHNINHNNHHHNNHHNINHHNNHHNNNHFNDYKKLIDNWKNDKIKIFISWCPEIVEDKYKSKCFSIPTYITFHIVITNNDIKLNNLLHNSHEYDDWNFNKIIQTINNQNNLKDKEKEKENGQQHSQEYIGNCKKGESEIPSYDFKESLLEHINESSQLNHSILSHKTKEQTHHTNNNINGNYNNDEHIEEEGKEKTKQNKKCILKSYFERK
ncbi:hypothetical protein PFFCH_03909 [Plasmodium falciparum FCH/4]|uniref:Uncharacterized protein n=1 Tax=Plasmodium falciparum FCH/4 TaxID=1036724 RepID=A0A024VJS5_PLAFA|nr:hypothetical protein PFFCH_03909 [Plasmodium falciparum FCH/4]